MVKHQQSNSERDEINFEARVLAIGGVFAERIERLDPDDRPRELVHLIDEEVTCFQRFEANAVTPDVGNTQFLSHEGGIRISLRHFYPDAPAVPVALNDRGAPAGGGRLVPAALLSRDLELDGLHIGRFVAGVTKHDSQVDEDLFCMQVLVMSVCGNGQIRENLTFRGNTVAAHNAAGRVSAFCSRDFDFVSAIFAALEDEYGTDGVEFVAHEVMRHRYYMGELVDRDIGLDMAFDAYRMQFGSYLFGVLADYKAAAIEAVGRLGG